MCFYCTYVREHLKSYHQTPSLFSPSVLTYGKWWQNNKNIISEAKNDQRLSIWPSRESNSVYVVSQKIALKIFFNQEFWPHITPHLDNLRVLANDFIIFRLIWIISWHPIWNSGSQIRISPTSGDSQPPGWTFSKVPVSIFLRYRKNECRHYFSSVVL